MFDFILRLFSGTLPFCLTVFAGGYLTLKTNFFQAKNFGKSILIIGGKNSFGAMCNSLSAAIGTGNIVGVAAAISVGDPGAVFWMWVSAFLGMVVKAGEIALGVLGRDEKNGVFTGGPHIYIKNLITKKAGFLACAFALVGLLSSFFCGNMTQINSAVSGISQSVFIRLFIGILTGIVVLFVICGGVTKIIAYLTYILPIMAIGYILLCSGVIFKNFNMLPKAFEQIFVGAFSPKAVTGGAVANIVRVISVGASKGIFSNEAGIGTAAIAHSSVKNAKPLKQSIYGIFEVFVDTIILCTLTALTILTSGVIIDYNAMPTADLTISALGTVYGGASRYILSGMMLIFAISSIIGWATYGISFCGFLFGEKAVKIFVLIYPFFCVLGSILSGDLVWNTAEFLNGILAIINLLVMIYLSKTVVLLLKGEVECLKQEF